MKKTGTFLSGAAIAAAAVIGGQALIGMQTTEEPPVVVTTDIQGTINDIGELATAEYGYEIAQTADKPKKEVAGFQIPFTASKVIYSYKGLIKAGMQCDQIKVMVDESGKEIRITLPKAEILSNEVDMDSLTVYDEKYSPFNTFTFSDMSLSVEDLKNTAEDSALENGLLTQAEENAKTILMSTVSTFYTMEEYSVKFR